jgi:hypothetical protein
LGFGGELAFDALRPGGTPCELADMRGLRELGRSRASTLADGLSKTYASWLSKRAPLLRRLMMSPFQSSLFIFKRTVLYFFDQRDILRYDQF